MVNETTPLVPAPDGNQSGRPSSTVSSQPIAYFLGHRRDHSNSTGKVSVVGEEEINAMPNGGTAIEFEPRQVQRPRWVSPKSNAPRINVFSARGGGKWFSFLFDPWQQMTSTFQLGDAGEVGTLLIPRKAHVKVEPKVHFANERTFLAWLHIVIILAGASVAIFSFAPNDDIFNQLYSIILLPVSIAFVFYSLLQYIRRSSMIRNHEPGPYLDVAGPTTLTVTIMMTIIAQFCLKFNELINR